MLGCNVNEGGNPNVTYKTCIEIRKWDSSPQSIGCIEYKGKYYVNNLPGNMTKPDQGLSSGSYAVGSSDYCDIIKYHLANQTTNPDSAIFIKFFSGIREYSISGTNEVFDCDEFMIFENELHQSLVNNNNRHPHDRSVWKKLGDLSTILKLIFDDSDGKQLTLPYWEECIGANCTTVYQKGISVVERVNSGKVDNCGNTIYDEQIFLSLIDNNTDRPSIGAAKPIPTWQGPFTDTQFLNRPVGYTQNGEPIAPGDTHTLITKEAFCDKFEWSTVEICSAECGDKTKEVICPKPIGVDENGDVITNGSGATLISQAAPYHPLKWMDVENGECKQDCEENTDKRLTLCYADGLHEVDECLEVKPANNSIIVDANGVKVGQIGVDRANAPILAKDTCLVTCNQVGDGIFYDTTSNKWEVKPANSSITVDATGVKVNIADGLELKPNGINVKSADSSIIVDANGVKVGQIGVDRANAPILAKDTCLVTCNQVGDGIFYDTTSNKWEVKPANSSITVDATGVKVGQIGVDRNGAPVMAGACLVTCSTDLHVTGIDDSGTTTKITLSNGTIITGPEIDNDDYVDSYTAAKNAAGDNVLTITMKSGTIHSVTLPAGGATSLTDLTNTPNYEAGTIQVNSSDGADTVLDITHPNFWPSAWVRSVNFPTEGVSGEKPPGLAVSQDNLKGGFAYDAQGRLVIPKTGTWDTHFLVASIARETKLYTGNQQLKISLTVNGVAVAARQQDDYTGNHYGEESVRPRLPNLDLSKGDLISVVTEEESPENRMVSYDIKLIFISSLGN